MIPKKKVIVGCFISLILCSCLNAQLQEETRINQIFSGTHLDEGGAIYFESSINFSPNDKNLYETWFRKTPYLLNIVRKSTLNVNRRIAIFNLASTSINDRDFYSICLDNIRSYISREIDEEEFSATFPGGCGKLGILAINFRDPDLKFLLRQALDRKANDDKINESIKLILSGRSALIVYENRDQSYSSNYSYLAGEALNKGLVPFSRKTRFVKINPIYEAFSGHGVIGKHYNNLFYFLASLVIILSIFIVMLIYFVKKLLNYRIRAI